jgi:hypothetical protein
MVYVRVQRAKQCTWVMYQSANSASSFEDLNLLLPKQEASPIAANFHIPTACTAFHGISGWHYEHVGLELGAGLDANNTAD